MRVNSNTDNYSLHFNSVSSKTSRGYNSNYMLNDNMLSNGDLEGDALEGTQTFHHLN